VFSRITEHGQVLCRRRKVLRGTRVSPAQTSFPWRARRPFSGRQTHVVSPDMAFCFEKRRVVRAFAGESVGNGSWCGRGEESWYVNDGRSSDAKLRSVTLDASTPNDTESLEKKRCLRWSVLITPSSRNLGSRRTVWAATWDNTVPPTWRRGYARSHHAVINTQLCSGCRFFPTCSGMASCQAGVIRSAPLVSASNPAERTCRRN